LTPFRHLNLYRIDHRETQRKKRNAFTQRGAFTKLA
jgi:hypothetical protein